MKAIRTNEVCILKSHGCKPVEIYLDLFHPFTAPAAKPRTMPRWNKSVRTINGNVARVDAAAISPQGMVYSPGKRAMPTGKVCRLGSVKTMSALAPSMNWILWKKRLISFAPIAGALQLAGENLRDLRAIIVLSGSLVVVTFIYLTLTTALTGRTCGMRLLSLRVIDTKTGLIPTGGQSIGRSFFYLVSLATGVGILFALVSREGYTAHDRFTRTAVVAT